MCFFKKKLWRPLVLAILMAGGVPGVIRAANQIDYFFPDFGDPFDFSDDRAIVAATFWTTESDPVQWFVYRPPGGPVLSPLVNPPSLGGFGVEDEEVREAVERAIGTWNQSDFPIFNFDENVRLTDGPGFTPFMDVQLDGINLVTFRTLLDVPMGALAITSTFFFERDFEVTREMGNVGIDPDEIEGGQDVVILPIDADGNTTFIFKPRDYQQGEIVDSDIYFSPTLPFQAWPASLDDVDDADLRDILGSSDIQAIATHELGHSLGLAHTWLAKSTMTPFLRGQGQTFPTDPFDQRELEFDDMLAGGMLYGGADPLGGGEIRGEIFDGQFLALTTPVDPEADDFFDDVVVFAPVFLGFPVDPGDPPHPDTVQSNTGPIRMIAQVLSGEDLRYIPDTTDPTAPNGLIDLEPDGFDPLGQALTIDLRLNDPPSELNGRYRFPGLPPRDDYVVFIDQSYTFTIGFDDAPEDSTIAISPVQLFLEAANNPEVFPPEFFGGTPEDSPLRDTFEIDDDPFGFDLIPVAAGEIVDGVDIVTNINDSGPLPEPTDITGGLDVDVAMELQSGAFAATDYIPAGGDIIDFDGDGYLDLGIAVIFGGQSDPGSGLLNRILRNVPLDPGEDLNGNGVLDPGEDLNGNGVLDPEDPLSPRIFEDITFGPDVIAGTADDLLPPDLNNSRDLKFGDFNGDGRPDIFVTNGGLEGAIGVSDLTKGLSLSAETGDFNFLYINLPDDETGVRFVDVSDIVLPGLLNRRLASAGEFGRDDSTRAAVGDIDCDGDLDLVISLRRGAQDNVGTFGFIDSSPRTMDVPNGNNVFFPTLDWASNIPLEFTERILINHKPDELPSDDPRRDPAIFSVIEDLGFAFVDETLGSDNIFGDDTFTVPGRPFEGDAAVDDPEETAVNVPAGVDVPPPFDGSIIFTSKTDRMPPVFPLITQQNTNGPPSSMSTPMSPTAAMPRLGPFLIDAGLDLLSVKMFQFDGPNDTQLLAQSGFYQNIDVSDPPDGIPDGVFMCVNYGIDYTRDQGAGIFSLVGGGLPSDGTDSNLFPLLTGIPDGVPGDFSTATAPDEVDLYTRVTRGGFAGVIADWEYRGAPQPLVMHDYPDWDDGFMGVVYVPFEDVTIRGNFAFEGTHRGQGSQVFTNFEIAGQGLAFNSADPGSAPVFALIDPTSSYWDARIVPVTGLPAITVDLPQIRGEVHDVVAADFDNDGDFDFATAESTLQAFGTGGGLIFGDPGGSLVSEPSTNRIFLNMDDATDNDDPATFINSEGFGTFIMANEEDLDQDMMLGANEDRNGNGLLNLRGAFSPNTRRISFAVVSGDVDNDGDEDLVYFNALTRHQLFLNGRFSGPLDLEDTVGVDPDTPVRGDAPMFFNATPSYVPPIYFPSLFPPLGGNPSFTGITSTVASADFDSDGRIDLVHAEGGFLSLTDFPLVFMNMGRDRSDASQVFKPLQAPYPAPRRDAPGVDIFDSSLFPSPRGLITISGDFNYALQDIGFNGYIRDDPRGPGAYFGSKAVDFNLDGGPDLLFTRNGEGVAFYLNTDSDEFEKNSIPDDDNLPDGVFVNRSDLLPNGGELLDPDKSPSDPFHSKQQSRRIAIGNFDGDPFARPDVFICNGVDSTGMVNAMLFNDGDGPSTPFTFTDVTESHLPTGAIKFDNTYHAAAADFDNDGDIDIVVANQSNEVSTGFRMLANDGTGHFSDVFDALPLLEGTRPRYIVVGDFDGLGEPPNDKNGNGVLDQGETSLDHVDLPSEFFEDLNCNGVFDAGEDLNGNGVFDASEDVNGNGVLDTEDVNGNGVLDPGEDLNLNGVLDTEDVNGDGAIDGGDLNGDGVLTCRIAGVHEGSWDLFISFFDRTGALLINDPTNMNAGHFTDESASRLPTITVPAASGGARAADVDADGDLDILVAQLPGDVGTALRENGPILFLRNDGTGHFSDFSTEFPTLVPSHANLITNATDLEVFDADGDGDLDVYLGTTGALDIVPNLGGINIMYINRLKGSNLNSDPPRIRNPIPSGPFPFSARPNFSLRGNQLTVELFGRNFEPESDVNFGDGIAVNNVSFMNSGKLLVDINVEAGAQLGPRQIQVVNPTSGKMALSSNGLFQVLSNTPGNGVNAGAWIYYDD